MILFSLSLEQLLHKLLEKTDINYSKPVGSPLDEHRFADKAESEPISKDQHALYRSITGSLMYIVTRTRRDLAVVTIMMASYLHELDFCNMTAAKRVFRCSDGTEGNEMKLEPGENEQLTASVDACWGELFQKEKTKTLGDAN